MSLDSPAVPPDRRDGEDAVPVQNRALDDTVPQGESPSPFVRRVWKVAAIGALVTASFLVLCYAPEAALLVFAAVWFGSALVQCAKGLGRYTSMGPRWNLAVVVIVLLTVLFGTLLAAGWRISGRVNDLMTNLSGARETIELRLQEGLDSAAGGPVTNPAGGGAASGGEGGEAAGGESEAATGGESGEAAGGESGEATDGESGNATGDGPDGGAPEGTAADALMDAIPDPMQIVGGLMGGGRGGASATQRVFTAPFTFGVYALFIFFAGLFLAISPAFIPGGRRQPVPGPPEGQAAGRDGPLRRSPLGLDEGPAGGDGHHGDPHRAGVVGVGHPDGPDAGGPDGAVGIRAEHRVADRGRPAGADRLPAGAG